MQCQNCHYSDKAQYCFCPICGHDLVGITILPPPFALLGAAFEVRVNKSGHSELKFIKAEYSGREISNAKQDLHRGGVIRLTIGEIPPFNTGILKIYFDNYPAQDFELAMVDPASLCFSVQGLYDFSPFRANEYSPGLLSFSIYDKPALALKNPQRWLQQCALELVNSKSTLKAAYDPNRLNTYEFLTNELDSIISETPDKHNILIQLSYNGNPLVSAPVKIEKNKLPLIRITNEEQIIQTTFDPGSHDSPFGALNLEIDISSKQQIGGNEQGSDLSAFRVYLRNGCLDANARPRYQNPDDQRVKLQYLPHLMSDADLARLQQLGQFDFEVEIEIIPNRELPFKPIKRFNFAMPVAHRPPPSGYCVIDFGTSNSCVTDEKGQLIMALTDKAGNRVPEHKTRIDFIRMGTATTQDMVEYPQSETIANSRIAMNFKSMLIDHAHQKYMYKDGQNIFKSFTPVELTSLYLRYLISLVEKTPQGKPLEVLATYPASFRKDTRRIYLDQIRAAGLMVEEDRCITEPEAIAFYYLNHNKTIQNTALEKQDITVAVFDCGGGTTDYAIVNYAFQDGEPVTNVLASWGSDRFAGIYLSFAVAKCSDKNQHNLPRSFPGVFDNSAQADYFRDQYPYYEGEKIKLSEMLLSDTENGYLDKIFEKIKWNIRSPYMDVFNGPVSHDEASDIYSIRFQLNQINMVLQELFDNRQLSVPEVDFVILAGNSCRLPLFEKYAVEAFDKNRVIMDLSSVKTAVALGAYIYRSRGDGTRFMGLRRSRLSFFRYLALGKTETIFKRWLDMDAENLYPSQAKPCNRFSMPIRMPVQIFASDAGGNTNPAFEVPSPQGYDANHAYLEMKYQFFKIWYRWKLCKTGSHDTYTDWVQIFDNE